MSGFKKYEKELFKDSVKKEIMKHKTQTKIRKLEQNC